MVILVIVVEWGEVVKVRDMVWEEWGWMVIVREV